MSERYYRYYRSLSMEQHTHYDYPQRRVGFVVNRWNGGGRGARQTRANNMLNCFGSDLWVTLYIPLTKRLAPAVLSIVILNGLVNF
jgi:hypothetical protein